MRIDRINSSMSNLPLPIGDLVARIQGRDRVIQLSYHSILCDRFDRYAVFEVSIEGICEHEISFPCGHYFDEDHLIDPEAVKHYAQLEVRDNGEVFVVYGDTEYEAAAWVPQSSEGSYVADGFEYSDEGDAIYSCYLNVGLSPQDRRVGDIVAQTEVDKSIWNEFERNLESQFELEMEARRLAAE